MWDGPQVTNPKRASSTAAARDANVAGCAHATLVVCSTSAIVSG